MTACLHIMVKKVNKLIKTNFLTASHVCFFTYCRGQDHRTQLVLNMGIYSVIGKILKVSYKNFVEK